MDKRLEKFIERVKGNVFQSAPKSEIIEVERVLNIQLPLLYVEFLMKMGNGITPFWQGSDYEVNKLIDIQIQSKELLAENNHPYIENIFSFWMHQGYQFCFFYLDNHIDNPAIFYFNECNNRGVVQVSNSFDDFLCHFPENLGR